MKSKVSFGVRTWNNERRTRRIRAYALGRLCVYWTEILHTIIIIIIIIIVIIVVVVRGAKRINDARTCNNNWTCSISPRSLFAVHHSISECLCVQPLHQPTKTTLSPTRSGSREIYLSYFFLTPSRLPLLRHSRSRFASRAAAAVPSSGATIFSPSPPSA